MGNVGKKTVVVLGGGYVASKIKEHWSLRGYRVVSVSRATYDYLTLDGMTFLCVRHKPTMVINTYGYTGVPNVDSCEVNRQECFERNVMDTWKIVSLLDYLGIPCINISSGCIYNDLTGQEMYTEQSPHNFGISDAESSTYSKSKSAFESMISSVWDGGHKLYHLRIRMPFDYDFLYNKKDYLGKIIKYDKMVNYSNSLTSLYDLVKFIEVIVEGDVPYGIYNVVNGGGIDAESIMIILKAYDIITAEPERWYTVDELKGMGIMKCNRSNCVLSNDKMRQYYDCPDVQTSLIDTIETYKLLQMI